MLLAEEVVSGVGLLGVVVGVASNAIGVGGVGVVGVRVNMRIVPRTIKHTKRPRNRGFLCSEMARVFFLGDFFFLAIC